MARRCTCARLLSAVELDPRLRTLPLAVRMLFLLVAEASARMPTAGLLPFRETRRVSLLVSAPETEVETGLETLLREGLLREEAGGLAVPMLLDLPPRAEAARRNGAAGGRPRKGETAEAARERRQREMLLPMPAAKPTETQAEKPAAPATTTVVSSVPTGLVGKSRAPSARETPDWVSLGEEVAELARLDGARGGFDYRPVQTWLAEGATPDQVRAAVQRAASRPTYSPHRVKSIAYFAAAVADERTRARGAAPIVVQRDTAEDAARVAAAERRIQAALRGESVAAA